MKKLLFMTLILTSFSLHATKTCNAVPVDLLVLGDSQTGAAWSKSYYGDFLQKCLKNNSTLGNSFIVYGRGGTQPIHWLDNSGLDKIPTIQRDPLNNKKNIGVGDEVPLCKKRLGKMLEAHQPKMVLAFFGDNLLHLSEKHVTDEFNKMIAVFKNYGILSRNCFIMTPTYEMEVTSRRNVPQKNLATTLKINKAIKAAVGDKCQLIDGIELMKNSSYLLPSNLLKRIQSGDMQGCLGKSENDNIHICGEVAQDLAERVCSLIKP